MTRILRLACGVLFLLAAFGRPASAQELIQSDHHYRCELPPGWEVVPNSDGDDYHMLPVGSSEPIPYLAVRYGMETADLDPPKIMRDLKTGMLRGAAKYPALRFVIDEPTYDAATRQITLDHRIERDGVTVTRSHTVCLLGQHVFILVTLSDRPKFNAEHQADFNLLLNSLKLESGYEYAPGQVRNSVLGFVVLGGVFCGFIGLLLVVAVIIFFVVRKRRRG